MTLKTHQNHIARATAVVSVCLALTACARAGGAPSVSAAPSATATAATAGEASGGALPAFRDCEEFTAHMREVALPVAGERGGLADTYYNDSGGRDLRTSDERRAIDGPAGGPAAADVAAAAAVATDGRLVVSAGERTLRIVDAAKDKPRYLGKVALPGTNRWGNVVLLVGPRAVVISPADLGPVIEHAPSPPGAPAPPAPDYTTDITVIDLADPAHPGIVTTEEITGRYVAAYASGGAARIVLATDPERRVMPADDTSGTSARALVRGARAEDWLPHRQILDRAGKTVADGPLLDCSDVRRPPEDAGLDLLSVLTVDPAGEAPLVEAPALGILASGDLVGASAERLFVATTTGWAAGGPAARPAGAPMTRVHAFDTTGPAATSYVGSAGIDGYPDDRPALSARGRVLRVVTASVPSWHVGLPRPKGAITHDVSTVGERDGAVTALGTKPIGVQPRALQVLRWFDDLLAVAPVEVPGKARMYPNDNAGPLRLVDLSDPAAPKDGATLDLPGDTVALFSVGDGLVVGSGLPAAGPLDDNSVEVSTLDVGDPSAPRPIDRVSWGHGEVYQSAVLTVGGRTLVFSTGWVDADGPCPAGLRCLDRPRPTCLAALACPGNPADSETSGTVVTAVGAGGRLSRAGWLAGAGSPLLVGGRLVVPTNTGLAVLDPGDLAPLGSVRYPDSVR